MTTLVALCSLVLVYTCVQANFATNDFHTENEIESFEEIWNQNQGNDLQKVSTSCKCKTKSCECCAKDKIKVGWKTYHPKACVVVKYANSNEVDFELKMGVSKKLKKIADKRISLKHPPRLCYKKKFGEVCVQFTDIDLAAKHMCVHLKGKVDLKIKKYNFNWKVGCFKIPMLEDEMMSRLDEEELLPIGELDARDIY